MPASTPLYYRLRIRNAGDSADLLVLSSVPSDTNPYLVEPPSGDGTQIDITAGTAVSGEYVFRVIDALTGGVTRVVTAALADANANPQFAGLRCYGEESVDGTWASPVIVTAGYLTRIRYVDALVAEIHVGEGSRAEQRAVAFATLTTNFAKGTNMIGEPIPGGWGPVPPMGKARFQVVATYPSFIRLRFLKGPLPFDWLGLSRGAAPWFVANGTYLADDPLVRGDFPRLRAECLDPGTSFNFGAFLPVAAEYQPVDLRALLPGSTFSANGDYAYHEELLVGRDNTISVAWPTSSGTQPIVGAQLFVRVYPIDITAQMPLHYEGHPVDYITALWTDAGIAYDATIAAAVRAALGPSLVYRAYITGPSSVYDAMTKPVFGPLGLAARTNPLNGKRELLLVRRVPSTLPSETIDVTEVDSNKGIPQGTPYDLDEKTQINRVTFKRKTFDKWIPKSVTDTGPIDYVVVTDLQTQIDNGTVGLYAAKEITYEIPGDYAHSGTYYFSIQDMYVALANELFDRFGQGGIQYEVPGLRGIVAREGDFVQLNLPDIPNAVVGASPVSQRGGTRVAQILKRTNLPGAPAFIILDGGSTAQASVAPTFTLTKLTGDSKHYGVFTLTNAAALIAAGVIQVTVFFATGAGAPSGGALLKRIFLATDPTTFNLPKQAAGTTVWCQARSVQYSRIPSAFTAWASLLLDAYPSLTGLTSAAGANNTERKLSWTNPDTTGEIRVRWRVTGATDWEFTRYLPPTTASFTITFLAPGTAYDVEVCLIDYKPTASAPNGGAGPASTLSFIAGAAVPTLPTPFSPSGWAGAEQGLGYYETNGQFGIDVTAASYPCYISAEVAVETAVGSGIYGSFQPFDYQPAVQGYRSRTRCSSVAANDGLRRQLRAQAVYPNATSSPYTAIVTVNPWTAQAPILPAVAAPAVTINAVTGGTIASPVDVINTSYTVPAEPCFDYVRYRIRMRRPGTSTWSDPVFYTGGRDGTDQILVSANLEIELRLDSVNTDGVIGVGGAVVSTITPPFSDAIVLRDDGSTPYFPNEGTCVIAEPLRTRFIFVPGPDVTRVQIFAKEYAAAPPTVVPELDNGIGAPVFNREVTPGTLYSVAYTRSAGGNFVGWEVIPYDRWGQRGQTVYGMNPPDPTAVPAAPTAASNTSVPAGGSTVPQLITNSVTPASGTQGIRCYRNGLYEGDYGPFTAGVPHAITHLARSGQSDVWEYVHTDGPPHLGRESARTTAFITNTPTLACKNLFAGSTMATALFATPDGTEYVAVNTGTSSDNPPSVVAVLQRATSGAGPWTDVATYPMLYPPYVGGIAFNFFSRGTFFPGSGTWFFRCVYRASGYNDSTASTADGPFVIP